MPRFCQDDRAIGQRQPRAAGSLTTVMSIWLVPYLVEQVSWRAASRPSCDATKRSEVHAVSASPPSAAARSRA